MGPRAIGVVLSGVLDDGTAGLSAIANRGGITIAQDPTDALYPGMPTSAIQHVPIDHITSADQIGKLLNELVTEDIDPSVPRLPDSSLLSVETDIALMKEGAVNAKSHPGTPSGYSCPDCNGVLWEIDEPDLLRFRCRVGHAWSAAALLGEQDQRLEGALWMALRGLEEKAALARDLRDRAHEQGRELTAQRFASQAEEAGHAASLLRSVLESRVGSQPTDNQPAAEDVTD